MRIFNPDGVDQYGHILRYQHDLLREKIINKLLLFRLGYNNNSKVQGQFLYRIKHEKNFLHVCLGDIGNSLISNLPKTKIPKPTKAFCALLNDSFSGLDMERSIMECVSNTGESFSIEEIDLLNKTILKISENDPTFKEKLDAVVIYYLLIHSFGWKFKVRDIEFYDYNIPLLKRFIDDVAPTLLLPNTYKQLITIYKFHSGDYEPIYGYETECELLQHQKNDLSAYPLEKCKNYASLYN